MPKIIKIKESDIRKIAKSILEQNRYDDFDTNIQPEELPQDTELSNDDFVGKERGGFPMDSFMDGPEELTLAKDNNGLFYVLKNAQNGSPQIVAKSK